MKINTNAITRVFHKAAFKAKKHSPEMLLGAGVIGVVASTIMACKATTKLDSVLEESKENLEKIHNYVEEKGYSEKYTEEDSRKDLTITYTQAGVKLVKLYAPTVALSVLSLTAIIKGHTILRKRNIALAAAYTAIDKSFKGYRSRVIDRFGKELDRELKYNLRVKEVEEKTVDKNGNEVTEKKMIKVVNPSDVGDYAKIFAEGCMGWEDDPELTMMFLKQQQCYANDKLRDQGYLFLNQVYDMLGIPRTKAGQIVGWIYDKEGNAVGDNYVDFGIYNVAIEANRDFVNGYGSSLLLDFNVDGDILDLF
jgi:hypothetical protein